MLESINSPDDLKNLSIDQLKTIVTEIRKKIITVMKKNGGHLASSLGTVEIITALHYVFDAPNDNIIFDVGHQSYTHKILTGRREQFDTIRQKGGLSGFPRRKESKYDIVDTGHSSTSISSATGFAIADKLNNKKSHTIALIGDAAFGAGEVFEGLNFISHRDLPLLIILNDNEMSINKNVGGISEHFSKITVSKSYQKLTDLYEYATRKKKGIIKFLFWFAKKIETVLKVLIGNKNIFNNLGLEYIGPIDGHNLELLIFLLDRIKKNVNRPVLLHLKTKKGKGFLNAEDNPDIFHGVTPFLMESGKVEVKEQKTFTQVYGEKILQLAKKNKKIVVVTPAMKSGCGVSEFASAYPDRFFDVGIAEQHAVTFSGALAFAGLRPILSIYSTFLQRGIDQLFQDICISNAPVLFAIDRAGIVGPDGETHQGQFDISYLRMLPNISLLSPCCKSELESMLEYAMCIDSPVAIRYPRAFAPKNDKKIKFPPIKKSPIVTIKTGKDILFVIIGPFLEEAKISASMLVEKGFNAGIIYLRFLKPLPEKKLINEIKKYKAVIVIEENVFIGSVSQEIASIIAKMNLNIKFSSINIPDKFIEHDTRSNILKELGFTQNGLYKKSIKLCNTIL